jgi:hypothetical protein
MGAHCRLVAFDPDSQLLRHPENTT